jgi:hypothetical protein
MSWVKVESYYDDLWNTPWPLMNLRIDLDKKLVVKAQKVDHNEDDN